MLGGINRPLTNKQNRFIARGGIPAAGAPQFQNNPRWSRVINQFQLPELMTEDSLYDACFVNHQQLYRFRDTFVYPFLQQRAAAGANAGHVNSGLPRALTPDSLTAMVLVKIHHDVSYRLLGTMFGVKKSSAQYWVKKVRNHIFILHLVSRTLVLTLIDLLNQEKKTSSSQNFYFLEI